MNREKGFPKAFPSGEGGPRSGTDEVPRRGYDPLFALPAFLVIPSSWRQKATFEKAFPSGEGGLSRSDKTDEVPGG